LAPTPTRELVLDQLTGGLHVEACARPAPTARAELALGELHTSADGGGDLHAVRWSARSNLISIDETR
jgi:hypothetical protein